MPTIRPLTTADTADCLAMTADRGWRYPPERWRFLLANAEVFGCDDPAGGLAGAVLLARYKPKLAAIGTLLVATRHSRTGLGTRLMRYVLELAGSSTTFLYATPMGRPLYEKLGFQPVHTVAALTGRFAADDIPDATRAAGPADLAAITRLDAEVFGADRSALLAALPGYARHLRVMESAGRITGFVAALPGVDQTYVGPLVAASDADARTLITSVAGRSDDPVRLDLDRSRAGLVRWLTERGLADVTGHPLMVLGDGALPGDRSRLVLPLMSALG
ncbi:MAG TPA: GNAT family N-acetyltransferase [Pseudonocardiaceae bacterium]|nr:GNAT family N-acetyltransferase [Pseudonocardiaceae bacterium]